VTAEKLFFHIFFKISKNYSKNSKKKFQKIQKIQNNFFCQFYIPINPESAKNPIKNGPVRIKDQLFDFSLHEMIT
jgi:hypothetical protein